MTKVEPLNIENIILHKLDDISISTTITCSICIDDIDITDNENIKILNCSNKHIFHIVCINNWLKVNNICPLCREEIKNNIQVEEIKENNCILCCTCFSCFIFLLVIGGIIYLLYNGMSHHN